MQTKLKFILCTIIILTIMVAIGCVYLNDDIKGTIENTVENTVGNGMDETLEEESNTIENTIVSGREESTITTIEDIEDSTEESTVETETDKEVDTSQAIQPISLGKFRLTAYCPCEKCCGEWANKRPVDENGNKIVYGSTGERLSENYSIAVDPTVIPYGTEIIINGHTYKAQDCGGSIKGNRIDIYMLDHQEASDFGIKYAEVFVIPN